MKEQYALALDIGTQSVRAIIFSKEGETLYEQKVPYEKPYFSSEPGYAEQYADFFIDRISEACLKLKAKSKDAFSHLLGVSMSCFRDTAVILDKDYKPIRPVILWLDQRRAKCESRLPVFTNFLLVLSGMKATADLNRKRTVANWLQENEKDNWAKMEHYWNISTYFIYRLTGSSFDTASSYTGHYPINTKKRRWQKKYEPTYPVFGVDIKYLPTLKKEGSVVGSISEEGNKLTGLPIGLPIYGSAGDKSCETLGVGCIDSSLASISYGTACSIEAVNKKYKEPETFLPAYSSPVPDLYDMEVQIYRGYWMLQWFIQNFATEDASTALIQKMAAEEVLNKKMMEIPPGSEGLILQPYWGPGLKRPLARGAILGFSDYHTKYHFYRSIIEGIAYALREGLEGIEKKRHKKVTKLRVSGGGAKSPAICQITADIFNLPVTRIQTYETASLGCAITVFVQSKVYSSYQEAIKHMVHEKDVYLPIKENVKIYDGLYKHVYRRIYPHIKSINFNIRKYSRRNGAE